MHHAVVSLGQSFLSYANEEKALAGEFARVLEDIGWKVWWERSIPEGRRYLEVIQERLTGSDCIIVLWTPASGDATYVCNEAQEGRRQGNLIQVWLRNGVVPLEFRDLTVRDLRSCPSPMPSTQAG